MYFKSKRVWLGALAAVTLIGLSSCAAKQSVPITRSNVPVRTVELPPTISNSAQVQNNTVSPRPGAKAPIADRPINVAGNCTQTEEDGFREQAQVKIENNEVRSLDWKLWVGKRGQCTFDGGQFSQTQSRPHIEMLAKDGSGCKLMIWQTPQRVTLAHANCAKRCSPGIYDDAWPVMFHPQTGACARVG